MLKKLLIIIALDVLFLAVFIWFINATPDVSIAEIIIVPAIFFLNLLLAGGALLLKTNKLNVNVLLINAFIAPLIFHLLFKVWFVYYNSKHFTNYYFDIGKKKYEITLHISEHAFSLSDITNQKQGFTNGLLFGDYQVVQDTIKLLDTVKQMEIVKGKLIGYPSLNDTIRLVKD